MNFLTENITRNDTWDGAGALRRLLRHGVLPIREDDCSYVWNIPAADRCEWVKKTPDCNNDSFIRYTVVLFCGFRSENTPLFLFGLLLMALWLAYLFLILGTTADSFFCPSLAVIAGIMRLSENIAGVTILAFGNGAPDIFTSLVSGSEESIIMFTELIGAGVFVTAVIAASVAVIRPFRVDMKSLMRDTCFYTTAVIWIGIIVRDERVYLWEAISLILLYILFIVVVVIMQTFETREEKVKSRIPGVPDPDVLHAYLLNKDAEPGAIHPLPLRSRAFGYQAKLDVAIAVEMARSRRRGESAEMKEEEAERVSRRPRGLFNEFVYDINPISEEDWERAGLLHKIILVIRSPATFFLQLFIPVVNLTAEKRGWSKLLNCFQLCVTPTVVLFLLNAWRASIGPIPLAVIFIVSGIIVSTTVFVMTEEHIIPKYHSVFAFLGFVAAMMAVYLIAGEVMAVLACVGFACRISDAMLGITFLAWGNSIGDLISNTAIARQGFPRMGYAACFGGPMFNTLLGMGLTYGTAAATSPDFSTKSRISDMAPGCMAFLLCSLLTTMIYLNITGATARRSYGYLLYSLYFSFLLVQFLSEFHFIHPLGTDHRPD